MTTPTLREKRKQWLEALSGEDRHAIVNQLLNMTWNAAAFRVVNEARRLAPPAPEGGVQVSGLMHSLFDEGFFTIHMIAVRRLMDTYPLEGHLGVYSLKGLLVDMQRHHHLFTREAMLEAEGFAYDFELIKKKRLDYGMEKTAAGQGAYFVPTELQWERHAMRHQRIDELTDTTPENRHPTDTIDNAIFANLLGKAQAASQDIIEHATKFIAHAATPGSRKRVNADGASITLNHLWDAHKHICQVTAFVATYILGDACPGFLATPQFDHLLYIDKPLVSSSDMGHLQQSWTKFANDCDDWSQWGLDDYVKEFS